MRIFTRNESFGASRVVCCADEVDLGLTALFRGHREGGYDGMHGILLETTRNRANIIVIDWDWHSAFLSLPFLRLIRVRIISSY